MLLEIDFRNFFAITFSILVNFVPVLASVTTIYIGLKAFKNGSKDSKEIIDKLEEVRLKGNAATHEGDKTEIVKRTIEEEKYGLFLQYHSQGLSQSKISFWFSLIFACIGFAIISAGIITVDSNIELWKQGKAFISLISGAVIDAVAALFFVQSNKARQLMIDFFDKLRTDRKFEESLKLTDEIPDDLLKSKVKILLSMHFADIKINDNNLALILDSLNTSKDS